MEQPMTHAELTGAIKALGRLRAAIGTPSAFVAIGRHEAEYYALLAAKAEAIIPGPIDKKATGIYGKLRVQRTDGTHEPGCKHYGCNYFVLDLDHDKFAKAAMAAYANACEEEYPALAADCRKEAQLAAQPPAVDRERRLREALEQIQEGLHAHCNEHDEECCRICLGEEITAALADQPPPDPREDALDDAEKALKSMVKLCRAEWFLEDIPSNESPAMEVEDAESALASIRAARGKA